MDDEVPSISETYSYAWGVLRGRFPELLLAALAWIAFSLVSFVLHQQETRWQATLYDALVMAPLNFGALAIYLRAARGEPFEIADLFAAFRGAYPTVITAHLLFIVLVSVGFALLVLPGVWIATRLSFVAFLVMDEGATAMGAVRESWRRTEGHSWRILRLWIVGVVLVGVGLLLLGVGIVPAAMWSHVAFAALFVRITATDRESERAIVPSLA